MSSSQSQNKSQKVRLRSVQEPEGASEICDPVSVLSLAQLMAHDQNTAEILTIIRFHQVDSIALQAMQTNLKS